MSETSLEVLGPDQTNIIGPDFFSYYAHEVADLLQDDERHYGRFENGNREDSSCSKSLFGNILEDLDSGLKKESVMTLLRECVGTLTLEVDEISDPIFRLRHNLLRFKNQQLNIEEKSKDKPMNKSFCKQTIEVLSSSANGMSVGDGALKSDEAMQVDEDEDRIKYELMEKHAKEYTDILQHMEKQLEAILETTVSRCRTMTRVEKQQLKTSIQKLHPNNLDRVAEILFRNKPSDDSSRDEVFVDLEDVDNTTLWRLHFYVMAVDSARKLAQ